MTGELTALRRLRGRLGVLTGRLDRHRTGHVAAGCAFYATLAVFPAASMLISVCGLVLDPRGVEPMLELLRPLLPEDAFSLLYRLIAGLVARPRAQLGLEIAVAASVALWSASAGTQAVLTAIDVSYEVKDRRRFVEFRLFSLAFTAVVALAAVLAIAIQVALPAIAEVVGLAQQVRTRLHAASLGVLVLFVTATLAWLYRFGPSHTPRRHRVILPGVATASVLWVVATGLFSLYAGRLAHFDATYGPLGAIATVMLWFWLSCYAVLVGAEVNALLEAEHHMVA